MTELDSILYRVSRPARYTGGEWNSVQKNWEQTFIRVALAYPDVYEIGMSNMAVAILYDLLNKEPDVLAERVYAPWVDMAAVMEEAGIQLFSLESRRPLKDFDVIGFSLGYELNYTNVLNMIHLAQIPVMAEERDDSHPVVIAGGSPVLNPEPMADFIDLFVLGDGEEVVLELIAVLRDWKGRSNRATKRDLLLEAATIPGIYVPSLYQVKYQSDGLLESIMPTVPEAKPVIERRIVEKLPPPVTRPVVPYIEVIHDRGMVEIQRGCSCGCRFCQAGMLYRPVRERPVPEVVAAVGEIIENCGYDEMSLVSLSTSDYTGIEKLVSKLTQTYPKMAISLPSLRPNSLSVSLVDSLSSWRKTGLTFAPEAGTSRLRQTINKDITEDEFLKAAEIAFDSGRTTLKLYFMVGLPTEDIDDIEGIVHLVNRVHSLGRKVKGRTPKIRISASTFVPKPHTPFQWVSQAGESELKAKHELLKERLPRKGVRLSWQNPKVSLLEAVLSRGDRRLGQVIYLAWKAGSTFDAWDEHFNFGNWLAAFEETGLEPDFYARRTRSVDELLPWSHINAGVTSAFLKREYKRALTGQPTPDCRHETCSACGLESSQSNCQQKGQRG
ncbi:TIGR03960 family B12-binding radical SAM protein [Chloroflexota bacterium]